jgi:hypothetical protein
MAAALVAVVAILDVDLARTKLRFVAVLPATLLVLPASWLERFSRGDRLAGLRAAGWRPLAAALGALAFIAALASDVRRRDAGYWDNWTNDSFWADVNASGGRVLASTQTPLTQIRAGRPLVAWTEEIGAIAYAPAAGRTLAAPLRELYGLEFPGDASWANGCTVRAGIERARWERFSAADWRRLATSYDFAVVVAPKDWTIRLPRQGTWSGAEGGVASYRPY